MNLASLGRFLCFLGLHADRENLRFAFFKCRRCGKIRDFTYPSEWRGFMKPRRPEKEAQIGIPLKPVPAERANAQTQAEGPSIEHFTRESLGAGRGKSA